MAKGPKMHIRLEVGLHNAIQKIAKRERRPISNLINNLLHDAVFGKDASPLPNGHAAELDDTTASPPA